MKIGFLDTYTWDYNIDTPDREPLGGTQLETSFLPKPLIDFGKKVTKKQSKRLFNKFGVVSDAS